MDLRDTVKAFALALVASALAFGCGDSSPSSAPGTTTVTPTPSPGPGAIVVSPAAGTQLPDATTGKSYSTSISVVSGGVPPFTFTVAPGSLAGFTIASGSPTATLSGSPTTSGGGTISLTISDANQAKTNVSYNLRIDQGAPAITISPTTLPQGTRPQNYNVFLTESGGVAPFTWSASGSLPPGITLQSSNAPSVSLSGVPTTAGSFSFTVNVTDASTPQRAGSAALTITIN